MNLFACLGFPTGDDRSQLDLVPEDAESLRAALQGAGVTFSDVKQAFLAQGDDRVGAVAGTTSRLADASINVTAVAAVGAGSGHYGMILWVAPTDYEQAAAALGA